MKSWPFLADVANAHGLPPCLLHAVGSRETNLRNVVGDGGHGHGVFQLDDRWHQIPPGFDSNVPAQTETAAKMLQALYGQWSDWNKALNCYNSGQPNNSGTAGGDYGPDVIERMRSLQHTTPPPSQSSLRGIDMPAGVIPSGPQVTKLVMPIGPSVSMLVTRGWLSLASSDDAPVGHVWLAGPHGGIADYPVPLSKDTRWWIELPDGTDQVTVHTDSPGSVGWCLELASR